MDRGPEQVLDEYLVLQAQSGSRAAFAQLVMRWSPRLLRYATRNLSNADAASDVVQETWASALRTINRLGDPARLAPWLYAIATRRCIDAVRQMSRRRRLRSQAEVDVVIAGETASSSHDGNLDLAAAIRRLPPDQRLTISLHYGEDLTVEEVAMALKVPSGTIKSRLFHARRTLKSYLEGELQ